MWRPHGALSLLDEKRTKFVSHLHHDLSKCEKSKDRKQVLNKAADQFKITLNLHGLLAMPGLPKYPVISKKVLLHT